VQRVETRCYKTETSLRLYSFFNEVAPNYGLCNGLKPVITKQKRAYGFTAFFNDAAPNCGLCNGLKPVVTKQKRAYGSTAFFNDVALDC